MTNFSEWKMNDFSEWWDTNGSKSTPDTYKGWEQSCREAFYANKNIDCRTCMNFNAYQSACNSIQRCQGEECLNGDLYEKKQTLELWERSAPNDVIQGPRSGPAGMEG